MTQPLMPKATAVWLIEKTSLTFEQVADFVGMHPLEVQAIADGEVAQGIIGYDPVLNGQLTREEIARCEANPAARLQISATPLPMPKPRGKGAKYTPVSKRNDRPDAIAWVLRHLPAPHGRARWASCSAPPRRRSPRYATGPIGTAPTSSRAIR